MDELEDLLSQLSQEGALDSQGRFHLDPTLAREKLQLFQEGLPAYALLRLIQGLQAAHCSHISVFIRASEVEVRAEVDLKLEEIQAAFRGEAGLSQAPAGQVAAGLNAAHCDRCDHLSLTTNGQRWDLLGDHTDPVTAPGFSFLQSLTSGLFGIQHKVRRSRVHTELTTRCRFSPCPFELDGRTLVPDWMPYEDHEGDIVGLCSPGVEWLESGPAFRFVVGDLSPYRFQDGLSLWERAEAVTLTRYRTNYFPTQIYGGLPEDFDDETVLCRTVVACFEPKIGPPSLVHLVRHGVVCETYREPSWLRGAQVLMDVSDLSSDLSGLKAIRDDAFQARRLEVQAVMVQAAQAVVKHGEDVAIPYLSVALPIFIARGSTLTSHFFRQLGKRFFGWVMSTERARELVRAQTEALNQWLDGVEKER